MLMMALKEDSSYGLFSRDSLTAANISCIHVKLTDSALRFIEDSVKSNVCLFISNDLVAIFSERNVGICGTYCVSYFH